MARYGRFPRYRRRARVIIQRVRARRRRRPTSFVKKNKTMLTVLALGLLAYWKRDYISGLLKKGA